MKSTRLFVGMGVWALAALGAVAQGALDLSGAVVVRDAAEPVIAKAATMLVEEIEQRTGTRLDTATTAKEGQAAIVMGILDRWPGPTPSFPGGLTAPTRDEEYALWANAGNGGKPRVYIVGHDVRGVLFGAGCLLRKMDMRPGSATLDASTRLTSAPRDNIRGHQLGYRKANNTWDAWTARQFEQYIRDLIVFGANAIELIPDTAGNEHDPLMKMSTTEMNAQLCKIIKSYGIDVWTWHALNGDMADAEAAKKELDTSRMVFQQLPILDAVFVPGGDPGDTKPIDLMPFLEKFAANLQQVHPGAELWLSTQGFEDEDSDYFFNYLATEKPEWLTGVIFGPWAKTTLAEIRERTPKQYRVRSYPDITHTLRCQYPVPHWDRAFAFTLGREPINPRPIAQAHMHSLELPYSEGFVSYSDGSNDDVNKIVWTALGWDPNAKVEDVLREYGRYFMGPDYADKVSAGLLALEANWKGPLKDNATVDQTLAHWQAIEKQADKVLLGNWRFQQGLLRAYYDAYIKARLTQDADAEAKAYAELARAGEVGVAPAIDAARKALAMYKDQLAAPELRARIEELGGQLFDSIGMQLHVKKYGASGAERGAVLEGLDNALNDAQWLEEQFKTILTTSGEAEQKALLAKIVNWEQPVPGAIYNDLGNAQKEPNLVYQKSWEEDPGFVFSPQDEFMRAIGVAQDPGQLEPTEAASAEKKPTPRLSWLDQAQTLFRADLLMHFDGLDPAKTYTLRAVYHGRFKATMTLTADEKHEVHGPVKASDPPEVVEFPIPAEATKDGALDLRWTKTEGRGPQVAEVWLVPNP